MPTVSAYLTDLPNMGFTTNLSFSWPSHIGNQNWPAHCSQFMPLVSHSLYQDSLLRVHVLKVGGGVHGAQDRERICGEENVKWKEQVFSSNTLLVLIIVYCVLLQQNTRDWLIL